MSRPDPIEYAETLYDAIAAANFSPIAFLSFGNAVKDGVPFRNMPRMAAEPFMRVVGEMLDLEDEASSADDEVPDAEVLDQLAGAAATQASAPAKTEEPAAATPAAATPAPPAAPPADAMPISQPEAPAAPSTGGKRARR